MIEAGRGGDGGALAADEVQPGVCPVLLPRAMAAAAEAAGVACLAVVPERRAPTAHPASW